MFLQELSMLDLRFGFLVKNLVYIYIYIYIRLETSGNHQFGQKHLKSWFRTSFLFKPDQWVIRVVKVCYRFVLALLRFVIGFKDGIVKGMDTVFKKTLSPLPPP